MGRATQSWDCLGWAGVLQRTPAQGADGLGETMDDDRTTKQQWIEMKEFEKYLKEARKEFCKEVNKYSDNLQLRTACDSFLIAFDQATEKAINTDL